ncbi:DUF3862 domain-containing protein [Psychrobacillus sp. FSL K6-1464]|uniref:DUF3862 domain-containing protein n=1 Tax=Psychrobacillus sp. FSL K6-1464 TaxID=2921545 RepID=UPI0030FA9A83
MKKFFKFGCLGVIALVVLVIIIVALSGGGDEETTTTVDTSSAGETTKKESPSSEKEETAADEGTLTEEKFAEITNGMTYDEVKAIIGSEGTLLSESGEAGTDLHTAIYEWTTDALFSSANFTFQGGKLLNKSQVGVSNGSDVTITLDEFNNIANGMTEEEVFEIVGGAGDISSESGDKGTDFYTIMYEYSGEDGFGANASLMFQGGKLQNKSQFGLE